MSSESTTTEPESCPRCQAPLPANSDAELCPKCILLAALEETRLSFAPERLTESAAAPSMSEPSLPTPKSPRYKYGLSIAKGGMGEVMEAREIPIGRRVAMKVVHERDQRNAEVRARFIEEAQITGQLEHPSIVPMHDLSIDDRGQVFYTMKRVEGQTLGAIISKLKKGGAAVAKEYALSRLLTIFQKVCDAAAFAHSRGVIHRDLKPENIMVGEFGEVLVMDWGLAKVVDLPDLDITIQEELADRQDAIHRTLNGTVMGTIGYMPPEQASGEIEKVGFASDIYALGAILYELLTLRKSVQAKSMDEGLDKIVSGKITPPSSTARGNKKKKGSVTLAHCPGNRIPQSLEAVTMRALSKEPGDRYESVEDLQAEIEAYQSGFATEAEEASFWKHLRLFVRRHKTESIAVLLIGLAISAGGILATLAWREAESQRRLANANEARAIENEVRAERNEETALRQLARAYIKRSWEEYEKHDRTLALLWQAEAFRILSEISSDPASDSSLDDDRLRLATTQESIPQNLLMVENAEFFAYSPDGK